ncbi:MAG: hypothetical protein O7E51_12670 [Acidobacteria bacterium]|nr:hypothetical protein [Acidobacteriota bacterium]
MENDIINKIRYELDRPIQSERQVVYLLAEVRKLLDHLCATSQYRSLRLYCNWAVHIKLERSFALSIVEKVDQLYSKLMKGPRLSKEEHDELFGIFAPDNFRQDFKSFLREQSLPISICQNDKRWAMFLSYYLRVIQDCPLVCESKKKNPKVLNKIVLTKHPDGQEAAKGIFPLISWAFYLNDQDKGSFRLNRIPRAVQAGSRKLHILQSSSGFLLGHRRDS